MPTYDYVCEACGKALEVFHSMSEAPRRKCPACGKPKLQRRIGAGAGILFKGSGFYQTDYRSDSYKKGAESGKEKDPPSPSATPATPSASEEKKSAPKDKQDRPGGKKSGPEEKKSKAGPTGGGDD